MRRLFLLLLILILLQGQALARRPAPRGDQAAKPQDKKESAVQEPELCKAYLVMEPKTGKILEAHEAHLRWPPASVTKLMLSLIVMEKLQRGELSLQDKITVSREASRMGGSQVYLKEGEVFTLEDLMKATMVASGNDAAYAIAEHIAGSAEAFVGLMNERAKALGMNDSEFHSVHGLPPSAGQTDDLSSCYDLALLGKALIAYPTFLAWTSTKTDTFRDGTLVMNNHNKLLFRMAAVDGLKTGYHAKSGFNVAVSAKKGDLRLIVVVMGSPSARVRDRIAEEKLRKYLNSYEVVHAIRKGEIMDKEIALPEGVEMRIKGVAAEDFSYPLPVGKKGQIKREIKVPDAIEGGITQGQHLGEAMIFLDKEPIGKVAIVSPRDIPRAGFFTRLFRKLGF